jgi:hypothetical protein
MPVEPIKVRRFFDRCALGLTLCLPVACGGTVTSERSSAETTDASPSSHGGASSSGGSTGSPAGATGAGGAASSMGGNCALNSDCQAPLVCNDGRCGSMCAASRDCPAAQRCVIASGGNVCQLVTESHCAHNSDCLTPLVCAVDQQCRNQCVNARDCIAGQVCRSDGTCADPSEIGVRDGGPACVSGSACTMPGAPCQMGVFACDGINPAFCKPTAPLPDGTGCGPSLVCRGGACVPG